jgi:predicted Zn-dependent protease
VILGGTLPVVSLGLLILATGYGCSVNPVSGLPEVTLVSQETEKAIGQEEAKRIEQHVGLVNDAALSDYLTRLGQRLAEQSPRRDVTYQFHVVDTAEPNAFALPGGHIYVTRGLLALVNSEDELAGVVGHEIGHVAARHSVQKISKQGPFTALTNVVAGVTGLVVPLAGRIVGGIGELATGLVFAPYSREQEREADRVGQEITARAGWEPAALSTFLHNLEREEERRLMGRRHGSFFDSHPATPERVMQTAAHARELTRIHRDPLSRSHDEFLKRFDGLVVGPAAVHGVLQGERFLHPDLNFTLQFPAKWKVSNSPQQAAALAPDGEAAVILQAVAEGNDPMEGVRRLERENKTSMASKAQRLFINGLPAATLQLQAGTRQGRLAVDFTWIAHGDLIYQLTSLAPFEEIKTLQPIFDEVAQSFRPLSSADREEITERRLRLVRAREAETLGALVTRSHSIWKAEEVAIANGMPLEARLHEGQLIKIAVVERYLHR